MSVPPRRSASIAGRVNLALLADKLVVVAGVGSVGSQVAEELANCVGRIRLIDHEALEEHNLPRHALGRPYLGMNKAEGMTLYLADEIPTLQPEAVPLKVDDSLSNDELDQLLRDADLIVAATDDRRAQRRIGERALALDIPAIFPGLYERNGGEVFVQRSSRRPCFLCWDGTRPIGQELRGVAATNSDITYIITLANQLSWGILDRHSEYAHDLFAIDAGQSQPPQLFVQNGLALAKQSVPWRPHCPACAVGPASANPFTTTHGETNERQIFVDLRERINQPHPPTSPPVPQQGSAYPIPLVIGSFFTFIAGVLGLIGAAIGTLFMSWLALVGFCLCVAFGLAVAGGAFWLFIVVLGHLGGH